MKNNVLNSWFKELCSLVFVQSFQAFLIAIIMSIIIRALASPASTVTGGIDAIGLLTIIALSSLSKIELLIKNIFGLTSGVGDPSLSNGRGSLMRGITGFRGFMRTLDNGRKVFTGVGRMARGGVRYLKAKHDQNDALIADKMNPDRLNDGMDSLPPNGNPSDKFRITGARGTISPGNISQLIGEIQELNKNIAKQNADLSKRDQNKKLESLNSARDKKIEALNAAIDAAKNDMKSGGKEALSGVLETAGALHGAAAGAVIGLAHGDSVLEHAGQGAGVGDFIGQSAANVITATPSIKNTIVTGVSEIKRGAKNKDAYKRLKDDLEKENSKELKELADKIDMYAKNGAISRKNLANKNKNDVDNI